MAAAREATRKHAPAKSDGSGARASSSSAAASRPAASKPDAGEVAPGSGVVAPVVAPQASQSRQLRPIPAGHYTVGQARSFMPEGHGAWIGLHSNKAWQAKYPEKPLPPGATHRRGPRERRSRHTTLASSGASSGCGNSTHRTQERLAHGMWGSLIDAALSQHPMFGGRMPRAPRLDSAWHIVPSWRAVPKRPQRRRLRRLAHRETRISSSRSRESAACRWGESHSLSCSGGLIMQPGLQRISRSHVAVCIGM